MGGKRRRLRLYDMRHLFITMMLDMVMDPKTVSEIVGSSPSTLMRHYRHASLSQQRKAVETMTPVIKFRPKNDNQSNIKRRNISTKPKANSGSSAMLGDLLQFGDRNASKKK